MDWKPQRFSLSFTAWREYLLPAADGDLIRYSDAVAEVERLRAALQAVIDTPDHPMRKKCKEIARAALAEKGGEDAH